MAHSPICILKECPQKSYGRLVDAHNTVRRDLCKKHLDNVLHHKNMKQNQVFIAEIWGEAVQIDDARVSYIPLTFICDDPSNLATTSGDTIVTN